MLSRRELLALIGFTAAGLCPATIAAGGQKKRKEPKLATVTLVISGMT